MVGCLIAEAGKLLEFEERAVEKLEVPDDLFVLGSGAPGVVQGRDQVFDEQAHGDDVAHAPAGEAGHLCRTRKPVVGGDRSSVDGFKKV